MSYNSRGVTLGRTRGRRMTLAGRATVEGTVQWRKDHAEPLPPGRGYCPVCWRHYVLRDGYPFGHGCQIRPAIILHGPLRASVQRETTVRVITHAPSNFGDGKSRCGHASPQLLSDDPTCKRCIRRLAHDVRAIR